MFPDSQKGTFGDENLLREKISFERISQILRFVLTSTIHQCCCKKIIFLLSEASVKYKCSSTEKWSAVVFPDFKSIPLNSRSSQSYND